jgi:hypothetical protein
LAARPGAIAGNARVSDVGSLAPRLLSSLRMDATLISILPVGSAVIPALPLASAPGAASVLWFLAGAGIAVGVSVIIRAIAAVLADLIGRTTARTVAEPVGELLLVRETLTFAPPALPRAA